MLNKYNFLALFQKDTNCTLEYYRIWKFRNLLKILFLYGSQLFGIETHLSCVARTLHLVLAHLLFIYLSFTLSREDICCFAMTKWARRIFFLLFIKWPLLFSRAKVGICLQIFSFYSLFWLSFKWISLSMEFFFDWNLVEWDLNLSNSWLMHYRL